MKAKIMTRASLRLLATSDLDPSQIMMSTVLYHLKQHKIKAEFDDDESKNLIVCRATMAEVLMGLSNLGWSHGPEEEVVGGLYVAGSSVKVQAQRVLTVMQTSIGRTTVWPQREITQSTTPSE